MRPLAIVVILLAGVASGQQRVRGRVALEPFSVVHGLPTDSINEAFVDSRGYIWFATADGLSRFDGRDFVNYSKRDGLPDRMVWSIAEDRRGSIWIATRKGIASITPLATRERNLFTPTGSKASTVLFVDRAGTVWTACDGDLCFVRNGRLEVDQAFSRAGGKRVHAIEQSLSGEMWVGTHGGLLRRLPNGTWRRYVVQPQGWDSISGLLVDEENHLWIANSWGMFVFAPADHDSDSRSLFDRAGEPFLPGMALQIPNAGEVVRIALPGPTRVIHSRRPHRSRDGTVWLPTAAGLLRISDQRIDLLDESDGLPAGELKVTVEDLAGNLWIGTRAAGVYRLARGGATTYTRAHGLASEHITSLFSLEDGSLCAANRRGLSCFRDDVIRSGSLVPPGMPFPFGGCCNQIVVRDHRGAWWFPTDEGLVEWPAADFQVLGRIAPVKIHTTDDGLDDIGTFRVWQDSHGALWVGNYGKKPLSRRDPGSTRFVSLGVAEGFTAGPPTAFAEDSAGNVWIGAYDGALARVLRNGTIENIAHGVPGGMVRDLKIDSRGRLWIAAMEGLARIDNPSAPQKEFVRKIFSRADGLASDSAYCVAELPDGRMAVGSQRGLDLLDLDTGHVTHLSTREGLGSNEVSVLAIDSKGGLWVGTVGGLSHLATVPRIRPAAPPQPRIAAIDVEGLPVAVAELGSTSIAGIRVEYPRRGMTVRFGAPHFGPEPIRHEYRLRRDEGWKRVGGQRAVVFDRLPAGDGLFEVRAVSANGAASAPASIAFAVIPPFWNRPYFIGLLLALAIVITVAIHRSRVMRLVEIERIRLRLATDLHDDLGSNLSRISILSELAKGNGKRGERLLDEIGGTARESIDALGDSIWSIDPRRDDMQSVVSRLRHFMAAVFEAQATSVEFRLPGDVASLGLDPEQRREIYLILKEALNNVARHSGAQHVSVTVANDHGTLRVVVEDDGQGFATGATREREGGGRGIPSMTDRARRVGGSLGIASEPGRGTRVTLAVPV